MLVWQTATGNLPQGSMRLNNEQLRSTLKSMQNKYFKTYFNGIDAKVFLQLCALFHDRCGEFQNGILVAPGVCATSFVNFSFVQHLLSIDVNQMTGELSVFWGRSRFCIANCFICPTCMREITFTKRARGLLPRLQQYGPLHIRKQDVRAVSSP